MKGYLELFGDTPILRVRRTDEFKKLLKEAQAIYGRLDIREAGVHFPKLPISLVRKVEFEVDPNLILNDKGVVTVRVVPSYRNTFTFRQINDPVMVIGVICGKKYSQETVPNSRCMAQKAKIH